MGEDLKHWVRVPVGPEAARWATRGRCRRVLLVVHNVTAATRLIDVLPLFRDDLRLQVLATCTGSSPFRSGVEELLASVGVPVLPWEQALSTPVDLAISASFGGQLDEIKGKLTVLSHGVGYNKTLTAPNTEHRTPCSGSGRSGSSPPRALRSRTPWSSPTPSRSTDSPSPAPRPCRPPSWPATPASTASSPPGTTGTGTDGHWECTPDSASSC